MNGKSSFVSPASTTQGATPVSAQEAPAAMICVAQHWLASTPAIEPHPSPPHASPQMSGQQTSVSGSWTPVRPLTHCESLDAAAGKADRRDRGKEASECVGLIKCWVSNYIASYRSKKYRTFDMCIV